MTDPSSVPLDQLRQALEGVPTAVQVEQGDVMKRARWMTRCGRVPPSPEEVVMAVIWFSDEDRERMRREREAVLERDKLFWEFIGEEEPFGVADRDVQANPRMETLDIRPWTARPGEEH